MAANQILSGLGRALKVSHSLRDYIDLRAVALQKITI
jgi:hypothetical protein